MWLNSFDTGATRIIQDVADGKELLTLSRLLMGSTKQTAARLLLVILHCSIQFSLLASGTRALQLHCRLTMVETNKHFVCSVSCLPACLPG